MALIGPDGAGKTTLTRMLEHSGLLPIRYVYMGVDIAASNVALPTSRLAHRVKARVAGLPHPRSREPIQPPAGPIRASARLINRLGEEWYRQFVSWTYRLRGYVVLYDRHFLFDFAPEIIDGPRTLEQRIHIWVLERLYPRPDLVILLDAPGEVLFARKGESTAAELERRRQAFLRRGARFGAFVRVDATRPLEEVYSEIADHVTRVARKGRTPAAEPVV